MDIAYGKQTFLLEVEYDACVAVGLSGSIGVDAAEGVPGDTFGGDTALQQFGSDEVGTGCA